MKHAIAACLTLVLLAGMAVRPASAMLVGDEYGWFTSDPGSVTGGGTDGSGCGSGSKTLCRTDVTTTCVEWQSTSGTIGAGPTGGTASIGTTCKTTKTTTLYYYYP